jgi:hydroxymethylpyrimidine/phosphomethylpyrimidine kinase
MDSAHPPVVLSISGFDPSSGAGVTADIKTIAAHGCFGISCATALTVQNTSGVSRVVLMDPKVIRETLLSLASDMQIAAVRIGMLGSAAAADATADFLEKLKSSAVVLDPILKSSSGADLLDKAGLEVLKKRLFPLAAVITPNLAEAQELSGFRVGSLPEMKAAAAALQRAGARNVVITGGHLPSGSDFVMLESGAEHEVAGRTIESRSTHGTGCAYATAMACNLANGMDVLNAARAAKEYVALAIEKAYPVGKGIGPINHLFKSK